ncbi:MAG TPA: carboxylesterase family protein [Steroidobacteraceae bacterium]|nr:carboxylesterase family protein [Steroidobacteraceae bacterium]
MSRRSALARIAASTAFVATFPGRRVWAGTAPVVETAYGRVRGAVSAGIHVFKGVRYGAPTGGANRFMPPRKPAPWAGIIDALQYGNSAPQSDPNAKGGGGGLFPPVGGDDRHPESEDCLFLNVWTPGLNDGGKRPVMVWLHGGGFLSGSGSDRIIAGENLARRGNVVVVTLNHRLNAFGFSHFGDIGGPEYALSGNAGMLDIVEALRWVRDNIDRFGGDPSRVMIFGESGGGQKVSMLMGCPLAKGLFHRAAIESGPGIRMLERSKATRVSEVYLKELGLAPGHLPEIQKMPTERLLAAFFPAMAKTGGITPGFIDNFAPVIDPAVLPQHPFAPTAAPDAAHVPLIMGWNRTEMTLFADPAAFSLDSAAMTKRVTAIHGAAAARIIRTYQEKYPDLSVPDLHFLIWSDYPTMLFENLIAERRAAANQAATYLYRFDWRSPVQGGKYRTPHTMEIPFVFDNTKVMASMTGGTREAAELAGRISDAWIALATSGDPNSAKAGLAHWQPYSARERATLLIDTESRLAADPEREERRLLHQLYPDF